MKAVYFLMNFLKLCFPVTVHWFYVRSVILELNRNVATGRI